jgi:uncharacterized membrane protein YkvA (DUF1232 family)
VLEKLKALSNILRDELRVYRLVLKDPRTPKAAKVLLWLAIGYTMMPFDIIPDFIPVVGHLDDMVIVPVLFLAALKIIPEEVIEDSRKAVGKEADEKTDCRRAPDRPNGILGNRKVPRV